MLENLIKIPLRLDMSTRDNSQTIYAKQGDIDSRYVEATLANGVSGSNFTPPQGSTAYVNIYKPDGKYVSISSADAIQKVFIQENTIKFILTEQMLTSVGTGKGDVVIFHNGKRIGTAVFQITVTPMAVPSNAVESKDEFIALDNALNRVDGWDNSFKEKYNGLEQEYAGELTNVKSQLAHYANKFVDNAGAHNSIYRGKYLGSSLTAAQQTVISSGTFEDLYIGDYWTIGGVNYRIAGFNYFRNVGDTALTANHVTIVPDTTLYSARMNPTFITTGGYFNSEMRTANLAQAISTIEAAFPNRVISHRQILTNATTDGKASGFSWYDSKVELMNEVMVYGSVAWGESTYGSGHNVANGNGRLPLFALRQDMVNTRQSYWLRDVVSASSFAAVNSDGRAIQNGSANSAGVRPAFSIS